MVAFKEYADRIILDRYGIKVEHICATRAVERERERVTFERVFYRDYYSKKYNREQIYGFPLVKGAWCNSRLKLAAINQANQRDLRNNVLPHSEKKTDNQKNRDIRFSSFGDTRQLVHGVEDSGF